MDAVTLAAANASAKKKYHPLTQRVSPVPGVPLTDGCFAQGFYSLATVTQAGTSRTHHVAAFAGTDLRLVYVNYGNNGSDTAPIYADRDAAAALPIKAAVELGGTIYPVTFNGSLTATIDPGGRVVSDPLPVLVSAGNLFYIRTYTSSTNWKPNRVSGHSSGSGGFVATTDLTPAGSAAVADSFGSLLTPAVVTAVPTVTGLRSIALVGDSIAAGTGDDTNGPYNSFNTGDQWVGGGGYPARALRGNYGFSNFAVAGDQVSGFATAAGSFRRAALLCAFTDVLCEYGRNDITGGRTLSNLQGWLVTMWSNYCANRGLRVWQTTITPKTASTDGFITTANQTPDPSEAVRVSTNDWLRDGAPLASAANLTAVATGTTGALRAGQNGHPLVGIFEVADLAESARNSGKWKPAARVVTDAVTTAGSGVVTSATAAFTAGDRGLYMSIVGAGASGAAYTAQIATVTSATQVTLRTNATTAVTGATAGIGVSSTDGTHPTPALHIALSAAIPAKAFG